MKTLFLWLIPVWIQTCSPRRQPHWRTLQLLWPAGFKLTRRLWLTHELVVNNGPRLCWALCSVPGMLKHLCLEVSASVLGCSSSELFHGLNPRHSYPKYACERCLTCPV